MAGSENTVGSVSDPESEATSSAPLDMDTPTRRGDSIAASLCLIGGLVGYFLVVPAAVYVPPQFAGTANSPAFLPNVLFLLLAALSVIYLVYSVAAQLRNPTQGWARSSDWMLAGGTALICIGYIVAIYVIGMTIGSALCVAATMYYFGERRPWVIGTIAIILPTLLWYFFVKVAHILLPPSLLGIMDWMEANLVLDGVTRMAGLLAPLAA